MAKETYPLPADAIKEPRVPRRRRGAVVAMPSQNFEGTGDEWAARVQMDAVSFRVTRLEGDRPSFETDDLEQAFIAAMQERDAKRRFIVYAITKAGRVMDIPFREQDAPLLMQLLLAWRAKRGVPKQATREPQGTDVHRVRVRREDRSDRKGERVRRHK